MLWDFGAKEKESETKLTLKWRYKCVNFFGANLVCLSLVCWGIMKSKKKEKEKEKQRVLTGHHARMGMEYGRMVHIHHCMGYERDGIDPILSYHRHVCKPDHSLACIFLFQCDQRKNNEIKTTNPTINFSIDAEQISFAHSPSVLCALFYSFLFRKLFKSQCYPKYKVINSLPNRISRSHIKSNQTNSKMRCISLSWFDFFWIVFLCKFFFSFRLTAADLKTCITIWWILMQKYDIYFFAVVFENVEMQFGHKI